MIEAAVKHTLPNFQLDASFATDSVGITVVFGDSGAGKTTLVNILSGLVTPHEGRIVLANRVLLDTRTRTNLSPNQRGIGYVFQDGRLFPHLRVAKNLTYGYGRRRRNERRITFDQVVDLLSLTDLLNRRVAGLSGGERQRVAIGRALLSSPNLLLFDEPLANLDLPRRRQIIPFIERLRDQLKIPIVYVTHDQDELIRLADSVVLLDHGRMAASGALEPMLSRLDLGGLTGGIDAGAVFSVTVEAHDDVYGLTKLIFDGGDLVVARLNIDPGGRLRIRVRARDVTLALERPRDISTLNVLSGKIIEISQGNGPQVDVLIDVGKPLWARVTRKSASDLALAPEKHVYALIKSVAFDRFVDQA